MRRRTIHALLPWWVCFFGLLDLGVHGASGPDLAGLVSLMQQNGGAEFRRDVLAGMQAALGTRSQLPAPAGWIALEPDLIASSDQETRTLAQSLGLTFGSPVARASAKTLVSNSQKPMPERIQALAALLQVPDPGLPLLLQSLCSESGMRLAALRGLARFDHDKTPPAILAEYLNWPPEHRREALNTLASRPSYAGPLIDALGKQQIPRTDLTADLVRQLRSLNNPGLNSRLTEIWGVVREPSQSMNTEIESMKRAYSAGGSQPGDASRGRAVFNQTCAPCHRLFDSGGQVGPDLTGSNRADLDYLLQNILFPNAVVPNEYRQTILELRDGRVVTGILKSAAGDLFTIQTQAELLNLPKKEVIRSETLDSSMMPEGLMVGLDERQQRDLIYYLGRPGQVPLPASK